MKSFLLLIHFFTASYFLYAQESLFSKFEDFIRVAPVIPCECNYKNSVDLSPKMPPVQNQGASKTCVGWSLGYAGRSYYIKHDNKTTYTSTGILDSAYVSSPYFIYNSLNGQRNRGINLLKAITFLKDSGTCSLQKMNEFDVTKRPTAEQVKAAKNFVVYNFKRLGNDKKIIPQAEIKSALLCGDPVIVALGYDSVFFAQAYSHPEKAHYNSYQKLDKMGHAVVIVGYNDKRGQFKFMNSFGTDWGEKGFGYLSYKIAGDIIREAYVLKPEKPASLFSFWGKGLDSVPHADVILDSIVAENLKLTLEEADNYTMSDGRMVLKVEMENKNPILGKLCQDWKIMLRFFTVNSKGEAQPMQSKDEKNKLANNQTAFEAAFTEGISCRWKAKVFYTDLNISKGRGDNTKSGYKPVRSKIRVEPVIYINGDAAASGKPIDLNVKF